MLADLHAVDPARVGLAEFGRPEGYLQRQVARWGKQWDATRLDGHEALDALAAELAASVPASRRATIVHGDYRLDNTMLSPDRGRPGRGGARLGDVDARRPARRPRHAARLLVGGRATATRRGDASVVPAATVLEGFPTRAEVAELYAERTGADLEPLAWCEAFSFFKLAVVCAGIVARVRGGAMVGDGFDGIEARIGPLVDLGRATLADGTLH